MTKLTLLLALLGLLSTTSCKKDDETRPANYDILAMENGHWEWESTIYFGPGYTPATEGYSRQLVFMANNELLLRRSNQADLRTSYRLSVGAGGSPTITYNTNEGKLTNQDVKYYRITPQNGHQVLQLSGEGVAYDAGGVETYHWVKE